MPTPSMSPTLLALALLHAFGASAQTQTSMPEVVVSASKNLANRASVAGFSDAPLAEIPAAVNVIGREQMQDWGIRNSTDAMRFDASVGDAYNAVGYAEQFSIRGFVLDNASSYRKDGFAIPGDTQIPLENKERIEILRGLAGLQAGVAVPGGIINYVTKRPTSTTLRSATLAVSERGTLYGALDLGGRFDDARLGYRINAAGERLRSYVKGADGERSFASAAFDWHVSPDATLQLDMDYQHKSQVTVPGYQLINGTSLPTGISADTLLNAQPWTRPVVTDSANLGLRLDWRLDPHWQASVAANRHWFRRDDFTAFPYGCGSANLYPGYCANGDYDVYDYQSVGESKSPLGVQAMLNGHFDSGPLSHALTLGLAWSTRHDRYGDYVYDYAGTSNIYHNVVVDPAPGHPHTGPVTERRTDDERAAFVQDVIGLGQQWRLHAGLRLVRSEREEIVATDLAPARNDSHFVLPNLALVYSPQPAWHWYANYAQGMEHGGIAPMLTANQNQALAPGRSVQLEAGSKATLGEHWELGAALYQIRRGFEYTNGDNVYVRDGIQRHRGLELSAQGRYDTATLGLTLATLASRLSDTGTPELEGKRAPNVPSLKATVFGEMAVDALPGLRLNGSVEHAGAKDFDAANTVSVPGYTVLNLGLSYAMRAGTRSAIVRANVDNVGNTFYWRDVTPALGGYLFPGAARRLRLSAQFDF